VPQAVRFAASRIAGRCILPRTEPTLPAALAHTRPSIARSLGGPPSGKTVARFGKIWRGLATDGKDLLGAISCQLPFPPGLAGLAADCRSREISCPDLSGCDRFCPEMSGFSLGACWRTGSRDPVSGFERFRERFSGHRGIGPRIPLASILAWSTKFLGGLWPYVVDWAGMIGL
jgi:hypothetical protein